MVAAAIIVPAAVLAWGPSRPTFTYEHPAPYVTFNSITNNPKVGDERNFVRVREAGVGNYTENATLQAGKSYEVMVYYHNNASSGLNASGAGIAKDVLLRMQMSANVAANGKTDVAGFITSSNAKPKEVYDTATLNNPSNGQMNLSFVAGSAKVTSNGAVNGATLPDSVFTTGAKLGYDSLNGTLKGCNEFAGYVIFKIKANQPNFTVSKQVQKDGETGWKESVDAKPGDKVNYLVTYKNTGSTTQKNVVLKDTLPKGMSYVSGTTYVANATNPNGLLLGASSDKVTTTGINIGNYAPGAAAYIKYTAKVASNDNLPLCGPNKLVNKAMIETDNGGKSDTATVNVPKECKPPVVKYTCDALKVVQIDRTHFKFTTSYTAQNATFKSVTYVVKNANGTVVDTKTSTSTSLNYTQATAGKYTVQATVTFTVNGATKTATSNGCKGAFEVKEEVKYIKVCELETKKIITIKESDFDSSKHSKNLADCKEIVIKIKVCELETKKIIVINAKDFDSSKHSKDLNDCKETPPTKIKVCDLDSKKIVTINEKDFDSSKHTKDLNKCVETPPELPQTGAGENIVAIVGLGALIASAAYYVASRRALNQ
jgi:uncharacterized repeat protein (TIGR01451 family)/LPXTG-motif cell wall-anchored protein